MACVKGIGQVTNINCRSFNAQLLSGEANLLKRHYLLHIQKVQQTNHIEVVTSLVEKARLLNQKRSQTQLYQELKNESTGVIQRYALLRSSLCKIILTFSA